MPNITKIWKELESREVTRAFLARARSDSPYGISKGKAARYSNRYADVIAYDRSGVPGEAYVNASVIPDDGKWWVAAQAPLPSDFGKFFRAIYSGAAQRNELVKDMPVRRGNAVLVQLTGWEERGKVKAHDYMPPEGGSLSFKDGQGSLSLRVAESRRRDDLGATYSLMELGGDREKMQLHHYYFSAWPDHGVPKGDQVTALAKLVDEVRRQWEELGCEVWVHWTGTFLSLLSLAIDDQVRQVPPSVLGPLEHEDIIAQRVDAMREYRCMLVQTPAQLELLYRMRGQM